MTNHYQSVINLLESSQRLDFELKNETNLNFSCEHISWLKSLILGKM